jgi:hypothetical protein
LPDDEKKTMAKQRLSENMAPLISSALSEGLRTKDIKEIFDLVLKKNGTK